MAFVGRYRPIDTRVYVMGGWLRGLSREVGKQGGGGERRRKGESEWISNSLLNYSLVVHTVLGGRAAYSLRHWFGGPRLSVPAESKTIHRVGQFPGHVSQGNGGLPGSLYFVTLVGVHKGRTYIPTPNKNRMDQMIAPDKCWVSSESLC